MLVQKEFLVTNEFGSSLRLSEMEARLLYEQLRTHFEPTIKMPTSPTMAPPYQVGDFPPFYPQDTGTGPNTIYTTTTNYCSCLD